MSYLFESSKVNISRFFFGFNLSAKIETNICDNLNSRKFLKLI